MKYSKVRKVKSPQRAYSSAGIDFFIPNDMEWEHKLVYPGKSILIPSGIKVKLPPGYSLIAFNKSGIAQTGFQVGACVIDEDYQGEVHIHLFNVSNNEIMLKRGQKIVQFVMLKTPYLEIQEVDESELYKNRTARGESGFGSSG